MNIQLEEKLKEQTPVSSDETVITPTTTFSAETNNENSSQVDSIEIVEPETIQTPTDSLEFETIPLEDRDVLLDAFFHAREEIFAGNLFFADCAERILGERALELIGEAVVDGGRFDCAEGILGEIVFELIDRSPNDDELLLLEGCLYEATMTSATTTAAPATTTAATVLQPFPSITPDTSNPSSNCRELFPEAEEVPARDYILNLQNKVKDVFNNSTYWYFSPTGSIAKNGPESFWWWEVFL